MPTSLGESYPPGLVPAHLNNDIPLPLRNVIQEPCVFEAELGQHS